LSKFCVKLINLLLTNKFVVKNLNIQKNYKKEMQRAFNLNKKGDSIKL